MQYFTIGDNMGKKKTISISIDEDLIKWIEAQVEAKRFAHKSHAFEYAIEKLRREAKTEV
jgi:Arc/MetJ-type ribon-helix-helix transcriptional regulator